LDVTADITASVMTPRGNTKSASTLQTAASSAQPAHSPAAMGVLAIH
jgi:hypothetical protein